MCECSDEYGPCEQHADTLVIREGASLHTADELALLRIEDCQECGVELTPTQDEQLKYLIERLNANKNPTSSCSWFSDPADEELAFDLADVVESALPTGLYLCSNDGYVIYRIHPDCPLFQ